MMKQILFIALTVALFYTVGISIEKHETAECLLWQEQAQEYEGYFLAGWQLEQCEARGIQINLQHKDAN